MCCLEVSEQDISHAMIEHMGIINQTIKNILAEGQEGKRKSIHGELHKMLLPF